MKQRHTSSVLIVSLCVVILLCVNSAQLDAQVIPRIETITRQAAERVGKSRPQKLLIFKYLNCQLNMEL